MTSPLWTYWRHLEQRSAALFDRVFSSERIEGLEHVVIVAALAGLAVHLALIALGNAGALPEAWTSALGPHYLAALYTPFSFILFAEVLLLILAIPQSLTRSIGRQFEIVGLVILRRVFKDLSAFESADIHNALAPELVDVLIDMGGGLAMFFFVSVFYHVHKRYDLLHDADDGKLIGFIRRKKIIALALALLLVALALYSLVSWGVEVVHLLNPGAVATLDVDTLFYKDLFTVMIFTDVLILLLSMWRDSAFHHVFRNASFLAATILLRLSLTVTKPYSIELALAAIVFAIGTSLVFHYFRRNAPLDRDARGGADDEDIARAA